MALMDGAYYLLAALAFIAAMLSGYITVLAYFAAICLVCMFVLLVWSIPLKLNWSSNLYGHLLRRFLVFLAFMIVIYATCYHFVGFERLDGRRPSFLEAIYFSITSFTTLQYGEFRPTPESRLLVCVESLMNVIAFIPFFAAFGWLYCQNRLWSRSLEEQSLPSDLQLIRNSEVGGWKEVETEETKADAVKRNSSISLVPCRLCGAKAGRIEKIYDIIGRTTPLALFVACCPCGAITKPSTTAFMAAWRWRRIREKCHSKKPSPPKPPKEGGG